LGELLLSRSDPSRKSLLEKRTIVSKTHGDKARFHRLRKQNIKRREMVRELRITLAATATATAPAAK
jgi:hypothetical protein